MVQLVGQAINIFCGILEICIIIDLILSWLPQLEGFKVVVSRILNPLFDVIRYLMKRSIFTTNSIDLTPFVALMIVSYIRSITV